MYHVEISCAQCQASIRCAISHLTAKVFCSFCHEAVPFPNASSDASLWLIVNGKRNVGPFLREQLAALAASQQLTPDDLVCKQNTSHRQRADSVPGLFPDIVVEDLPKLVDDATQVGFTETRVKACTCVPNGPLSSQGGVGGGHFKLSLADVQIIRTLAAGAMGMVYLARLRSAGHFVALKVLADASSATQANVDRFQREISMLASIQHPGLVTFFGAGQQEGVPFYAMEFVEGSTIADLVHRYGKLSVGDALHIIRRVAEALNHAFAHQLIHRDIKPENILISKQGQVKIVDLGLAKQLEADANLTDSGTGLGTPKYVAPEQARNAKHADHRSDIYSLGGVLYFLLTASEPFQGESVMELLLAKEQTFFRRAHLLNPDVPTRLDLLIDKMLARDPRVRYQNYADLLRDLNDLGMMHDQLSSDVTRLTDECQVLATQELVEVLFIDDDLDDIRLAEQALKDNDIPGNLNIVKDGAEARAWLRQEGKYMFAPTPGLIVFGSRLNSADSLLTLEAIRLCDPLGEIPVVMLANSPATGQFFAAHGYHVDVVASIPDDVSQFESHFQRVKDRHLTVIELSLGS